MKKILLIDDENSIARLVGSMAGDAGYAFAYAEDGAEGLVVAEREAPDLVIMDVMMPRMDGFTTCRLMRERGITCPVIFLSAKGDIVDKGVGFQAGGDDYMVKPFDPRELLMHIEAHLRRASMAAAPVAPRGDILHAGRFVLDRGQFRVTKDGERLSLTPKEFRISSRWPRARPRAVEGRFVEAAWGKEFVGEDVEHHRVHQEAAREGGGRPIRPARHPDRLGHRLPLRARRPRGLGSGAGSGSRSRARASFGAGIRSK